MGFRLVLQSTFGTVGPEGGGTHLVIAQDAASARRPGSMVLVVVPHITEGELLVMDSSTHDENVFKCLCRTLQIESLPGDVRAATTLPLTLGGIGVGVAMRIRGRSALG